MHIFHDPRCVEYSRPGHPERPERILNTVPLLKERHPQWIWSEAKAATPAELRRGHSSGYLETLRSNGIEFDSDCPAYPNIFEHAARAAGAAITAARIASHGERAFSLMRPPGHHALRDRAMGFCYLGNVGLAAFDAIERGLSRVAIWDFDAHHGNGTEALVANNDRIAFASIHQYPGWPGSGTRSFANVHNFPVPPFSARADHVAAVERALTTLLEFKPQLLLISAGFDAYKGDPITEMTLEEEDFALFGKWLRDATVPAAAILEGGYSDASPRLINEFLSAWEAE